MGLARVCLSGLCLSLSAAACAGSPSRMPADRGAVLIPPAVPEAKRVEALDEMVRLEGGTFTMLGDFDPFESDHPETVASFEIGRTEVTTAAYRRCVKAGACAAPDGVHDDTGLMKPPCIEELTAECNFGRTDREDHPINCVQLKDAEAYCTWRKARIPSEAEWQFAARGVMNRAYPWGSEAWEGSRANLCDDACSSHFSCPFTHTPAGSRDGHVSTAPVGSYPAGDTPQGIHDMMGNVWEWSIGKKCDAPTKVCQERLVQIRGNGWSSNFFVGIRVPISANSAGPDIGFRCASSGSDRDGKTRIRAP
jgi:formylglycine-generating enzyme required for sulfatase activity